MAEKNQQQGALETNRAATDRTGDKTKSLGLDWSHTEETRLTCSQEGTRVEPTGEAKERETPAHLVTHENGRVGGKHLTWNKAKGTAQNRVRWRALVEDVPLRNEED